VQLPFAGSARPLSPAQVALADRSQVAAPSLWRAIAAARGAKIRSEV
jgi:hypothetical protein